MSVLLPKVSGPTLDALYEWAKRMIVHFERGEDTPVQALIAVSLAVDPTTTDLDPLHWGVFKNTTSGNVYLAYNDAGTIKKVALT